ncbi:MAG: GMC family oxidoreductase [Longimicrobiaceae bacterium]
MRLAPRQERFDTIVIGSGFGGSFVARALVRAGERVLMLERGDWVPRSAQSWEPEGFFTLTSHYGSDTPYRVRTGRRERTEGACYCVGGPSVFYGGASFRFREADFRAAPEIVGDSGAEWPLHYAALEPYYTRAERILGVAGRAAEDPTEPSRSGPYPQPAPEAAATTRVVESAARRLGLNPFPIPLAINYAPESARQCVACVACDGFACAVEAKNDLATVVLPELIRRGLTLRPNTVVTRLVAEGKRVVSLQCFDRESGDRVTYRARRFVLAAGALASPHLLLASGLERLNPGGRSVGRYLMRHCNAFVFGVFARDADPGRRFHKQIAIQDFYFGHPAIAAPAGKLGNIQQVMAPPVGPVSDRLPARLRRPLGPLVARGVRHLTGLLVIAEDQPQRQNRVELDPSRSDRFGLPQLVVTHRYTSRDRLARLALIRQARRILREAGALFTLVHPIETFSHAVGTVRMGIDPATSALDEHCRFRGVENLYVVDGSVMPTSAGLNPSLTIAANALRVGDHLARNPTARRAIKAATPG